MKEERIRETIENAEDSVLVCAWNQMCYETGRFDDEIHNNEECALEEVFGGIDDALRAACYGEYRYTDKWFVLNGYGNMDSFSYTSEDNCPIDTDELVGFFMENPEDFGMYFICDAEDDEDGTRTKNTCHMTRKDFDKEIERFNRLLVKCRKRAVEVLMRLQGETEFIIGEYSVYTFIGHGEGRFETAFLKEGEPWFTVRLEDGTTRDIDFFEAVWDTVLLCDVMDTLFTLDGDTDDWKDGEDGDEDFHCQLH